MTLVEILVGMAVATILGLTVGLALVTATDMSARARRPVELKRDATFALNAVQRRVRALSPDQVQIGEAGDTLTLADGTEHPPYFQKVERDLVFFDGQNAVALLRDRVESLSFALVEGYRPQDSLLRMALEVNHEGSSVQMESLTRLRNE